MINKLITTFLGACLMMLVALAGFACSTAPSPTAPQMRKHEPVIDPNITLDTLYLSSGFRIMVYCRKAGYAQYASVSCVKVYP